MRKRQQIARHLVQRRGVTIHAGATVMAVPSAEAALAMLEYFKPDVLVSDIGMPEEDGYRFLRS